MKRGDIYSVSLDPASGHEQKRFRPVLILSPEEFNTVTGVPVVLPITSGGEFARRNGFAVILSGTEMTGIIRCDQLRSLDLGAGRGKKIGEVPPEILNEVMGKVLTIFE